MLAIDINTALGSSIMAFVLGVFIGIALGYIIWADREGRKAIKTRLDSLEIGSKGQKESDRKDRKTSDDRLTSLEEGTRGQDATNLKDRDNTRKRLNSLEGDALKSKQRGHDESK